MGREPTRIHRRTMPVSCKWIPPTLIRSLNGLYTNDKFCLVRQGRLDLAPSHVGYRRGARPSPPPVDATPAIDPAIRSLDGGIYNESPRVDAPALLCEFTPRSAPPGSSVPAP